MKLLFHLLLALLTATVTLAAPAPVRHLQQPLTEHRPSAAHSSSKSSSSPPRPVHLPYVVKAPASEQTHRKHRFSVPSWLKLWQGPSWSSPSPKDHGRMHFAHASSADLTCFCAGGAVCCHTATGLDCNAGYCGI
ncbi:hypothetical protein SEUCBS140593_008325 [Sporothrix eucalyptigena]|uniref:Hydrophobin n=1 Tax=Sporothrix eucalyptigena TaxID=1812306 RepID=A0ABP0CKL8_9PEZI